MRPLEGLGGGGVGCTYGHMDVRREDLPNCVVQDCVPFRAAAQKGRLGREETRKGVDSEGGRLGRGETRKGETHNWNPLDPYPK